MGSTLDTATNITPTRIDRRRGRQAPGIRWRRRCAAATFGVLALGACSAADDDAEPASEDAGDFDAAADIVEAADEQAATAPAAEPGVGSEQGGIDLGAIGRDVIIEMRVVLSSDDIERTVSTIATDAAALGGGIASSNVDYGDAAAAPDVGEEGYALLVVKVPPSAIDTMLGRIGDAGAVQSINQSAEDVTEQLVDLDVRISNARQSVETVRSFMERTEDLSELVALESELTRRQTELERLEAQQRNLRDRVALSTITIEVLPTAAVPEPAPDGDESLGDALRSGWDAFVAALFTIAFIAAVLLPFLVVTALVALGFWLVRRRPRAAPDPGDDVVHDDDVAVPAGTAADD